MFYSVRLTMAANATLLELGVRQLAARILFVGVAQRDAVRNFDTDEICCRKAAICANQVNHFYFDSRIVKKNHNKTTFDFKNFKSVGVP
jgi:hypothetical protein